MTALGRLELLDHNDAEAIRLLGARARANPADSESTYQLGVLYDRNGRTAEGVTLLRRAITLRANYPDPHYQLGRIALEHKDYRPRWQNWNSPAACCRIRRPSEWPSAAPTRRWAARRRRRPSSPKSAASRPPSSSATASA